jgi:group I intron endonuclease
MKKQNWYVNKRKYHFIYKTTCKVNQKYYLGMHSTDRLDDGYIGSGTKLWHSIKKYGHENFSIEILEFLPDRESLKQREAELVNEEKLKDPLCLNLQLGGYGGFSSESHRIKAQKLGAVASNKIRSARLLEKRKDRAFQEHLSKSLSDSHVGFTGKFHDDETKLKISKSHTGKHQGGANSMANKCWVTNTLEKKSKPINKSDLQSYLQEGWTVGRRMKF